MATLPVEWVLVVFYGPSAHRATYGRLDNTKYTKDYIQLSKKAAFLDAVTHLFPMAASAFDIAAIDRYMEVCERRSHLGRSPKLEILIETPQALMEIEAIARTSKRTDTLHFGPGDFAKGMGISLRAAGTPHPEYGFGTGGAQHFQQADIWHYPLMRVAVTARALGLRAFDGPYVGGDDLDGYAAQCRRARALGLSGKWAITEAQVNTVVNLDPPVAGV